MRYLYFTIFLVSGSALMFEVSLTRIFSISLWYHFAFMVISIAMLGIGSAGTLFALCCKGMKQPGEITGNGPVHIRTIRRKICAEPPLSLYAALSGISVLLCYILSNYIPFDPVKLSWEKEQFLFLALYCLVLSVPFFFTGLLFVSAFSLYSEKSMSVYSSDLLGAGAGSLAVVYLLDNTGPEYAALTASTLSLIGAFIAGKKNIRILSLLCLIGILLIGLFHPAFIRVKISPFKNLPLALQYPDSRHLKTYHSSYSRIDTFRSPAVRFAPGLSLKYLEPLPDQIGFAVDGNSINVITEAGDRSKLRFLEFLPSSLVYELRKGSHVAVLDPKGGLNALIAKHYGSTRIQIVESNAMMARIIRDEFSEFTGGVFDRNTLHGYGRNTSLPTTLDHHLFVLLKFLLLLFGHGLADGIGVAWRIAGHVGRDTDDLLLVH